MPCVIGVKGCHISEQSFGLRSRHPHMQLRGVGSVSLSIQKQSIQKAMRSNDGSDLTTACTHLEDEDGGAAACRQKVVRAGRVP